MVQDRCTDCLKVDQEFECAVSNGDTASDLR